MENKEFGAIIGRLINKENLSYAEAREAFTTVLDNSTTDLQQGAFLAALNAKGETKEEVAGGWEAIYNLDTVKVEIPGADDLVDNCGTGMDAVKTFNISTAASVVAAAGGVKMARHGARALSSVCGTVDMAEALGVDVECSAEIVSKSITETGIGLFNGMSPSTHPMALGRILSQIHFGTTLNISASLANPALPRLGVRGVFSRRMIKPVAEIMKEIGYRRALILHGTVEGTETGMDEASVCGPTFITELLEDGSFRDYSISPSDFGMDVFNPEDLAPENNTDDAVADFIRIISGNGTAARQEAVVLNTALVLYISGRTEDIAGGVERARELIQSGDAVELLKKWVRAQNSNPEAGAARLDSVLSRLKDPALC